MDIQAILLPEISGAHTYALVFLLGSLTVSSLSDLKRMAAQTDFAEVWMAYAAIMFTHDIYLGVTEQLNIIAFTLKWTLILAYIIITANLHHMGLSTMDIAAMGALLSTLGGAYIIGTIIGTAILNELLQPLLKKYGEMGAYPFLPTVWTINLIVIITTQIA
jgi:hypothetical protein